MERFKNRFFATTFCWISAVVLTITICFLTVSLLRSNSAKHTALQEKAVSSAELMREILDEQFSRFERVATQISGSYWASYVSSENPLINNEIDYFREQDIIRQIGGFSADGGFIVSMAVLVPNRELAIDGRSFWHETQRYFHSVGLPRELLFDIIARMSDVYGELILYSPESAPESLVLVKRIGSPGTSRMLLIGQLDTKQFARFASTYLPDAIDLQLDRNGEMLLSLHNRSSETKTVTKNINIPSKLYGWSYQLVIDTEEMDPISTAIRTSLFIYVGAIVLALLLCYILTILVYRPVQSMVRRLDLPHADKNSPDDELAQFERYYRILEKDKETIESLANQYYQIGQNNYLSLLLEGAEISAAAGDSFGIGFEPTSFYQVFLFFAAPSASRSLIHVVRDLELICYRKGNTCATAIVREGYAFILSSKTREALVPQESEINRLLDDWKIGPELTLSAGGIHSGLRGIHRSYRDALAYIMQPGTEAGVSPLYSFDTEMRFLNYLRIGGFRDAEKLVDIIRHESEQMNAGVPAAIDLIDQIWQDLHKYAGSTDTNLTLAEDRIESIRNHEPDAQMVKELWEFLSSTILSFETAQNTTSSHLGEQLLAYVREHFTSSALSQKDIADQFHVSRPTVSKAFKDTTGINFIDYLHRCRISYAVELIDGGADDIMQIANRCGYENEVTFKRAFLKNEGVTPREYLRAHKNKAEI